MGLKEDFLVWQASNPQASTAEQESMIKRMKA